MSALTSVGLRGDHTLRQWLLEQMQHQPPELGAQTITACLDLHDLVELAGHLRRGRYIWRIPVINLCQRYLELGANGVPGPKAGYEQSVCLLIQLGRVTHQERTHAIEATRRRLGLSDRQIRLAQYMPDHLHDRPDWVKQLLHEVRCAPWHGVRVDRTYHNGEPVTLVTIEAGECEHHVEVEVQVAVDVPHTNTQIPDGRRAKVLGVSVFFPAGLDLSWNPHDGGPEILSEARDMKRVAHSR